MAFPEPESTVTGDGAAGGSLSTPAAAQGNTVILDVDTVDDDSILVVDDDNSETTSLTSTVYRGYTENGRKYQSLTENKYWGPSDEKQFEAMETCHVVYWILDSQQPNPLFHAPIGDNPQDILDVGTGFGTWAIEVAEKYPSANVLGVDLSPPPAAWVPPNCVFEVDDVSKEWTWRQKFDLIHIRFLLGALTPAEWESLYLKCLNNLKPGGWIEHIEGDVSALSDDGSLLEDSFLAGWGPNFLGCSERSGRPMNTFNTIKALIEKAGFVDIQEKIYKVPIGSWPKDRIYKEAGRANMEQWKMGMEGWAMWLLTKYGLPQPWSAEEVRVYVDKVRNELKNPKLHAWQYSRRVWARKPEK